MKYFQDLFRLILPWNFPIILSKGVHLSISYLRIFIFILVGTAPVKSYLQTVGTLLNTPEASKLLVLLNPVKSKESYLIDNCGYIYNRWQSEFDAGLAAYLDEAGNLFRSGKVETSNFNFGGKGGIIEKYDWNGNLLWQYVLASERHHLHHDFKVLPNGNLIVIAWEYFTKYEILQKGRDPNFVNDHGFFSEMILEIDPQNDFQIVWEWHATDHLIQDFSSDLMDFGSPLDYKHRLNINLNPSMPSGGTDWLHINSIDYNSELDQILLSCNAIDEIIIIDHSTKVEESSDHFGGFAKRGGDLLFRWGNPENYFLESKNDLQLFKQHDAQWIRQDGKVTDRITLFNNGLRNGNVNFSTVDEILLKREGEYNYIISNENVGDDIIWRFNENGIDGLYSKRMSGANRLQNGHTVICESDSGTIFEIDQSKNEVWRYRSPLGSTGVFAQGDIPFANVLFKASSYNVSYFSPEVTLQTNFEKIELEPIDNCELFDSISSVSTEFDFTDDDVLIKVSERKLYISSESRINLEIFDIIGRKCFSQEKIENDICIDLDSLETSIFFIHILNCQALTTVVKKIFIKA